MDGTVVVTNWTETQPSTLSSVLTLNQVIPFSSGPRPRPLVCRRCPSASVRSSWDEALACARRFSPSGAMT